MDKYKKATSFNLPTHSSFSLGQFDKYETSEFRNERSEDDEELRELFTSRQCGCIIECITKLSKRLVGKSKRKRTLKNIDIPALTLPSQEPPFEPYTSKIILRRTQCKRCLKSWRVENSINSGSDMRNVCLPPPWQEHLRKDATDLNCPICKEPCSNENSLTEHVEKHLCVQCLVCDMTFCDISLLQDHMQSSHCKPAVSSEHKLNSVSSKSLLSIQPPVVKLRRCKIGPVENVENHSPSIPPPNDSGALVEVPSDATGLVTFTNPTVNEHLSVKDQVVIRDYEVFKRLTSKSKVQPTCSLNSQPKISERFIIPEHQSPFKRPHPPPPSPGAESDTSVISLVVSFDFTDTM